MGPRRRLDSRALRDDAAAGFVLGVASIPNGLATGLLAGVNPVAGLYAYLVGTTTGAVATSSTFMAVQATGSMAVVVADVAVVRDAADPARALTTLTVLAGLVMLAAGLLRLGLLLRFVSRAVLVGFITAVGVTIVLSQLTDLTGAPGQGGHRLQRAFVTLAHPGLMDLRSLAVGAATIVLALLLGRTRVGALGMVVAVAATTAAAAALSWNDVATLADLGDVPASLPLPQLPDLQLVTHLLLPAVSLAFVGLIQGAAISWSFPNPDGRYPNPSRDFVGQGAANLASGLLQGMPVGGSLSGTVLNKAAGARSRMSLVFAGIVMALSIVMLGPLIGHTAMPALAGLLVIVGCRTVRPDEVRAVWRTGPGQKAILAGTFALTIVVPLQYAVLVGVALSIVLHTARQSFQVAVKRWMVLPDGDIMEAAPPATLPPDDVVVLQPYGSLFFAAVPMLEAALPEPAQSSRNSVVILRLGGQTDLGATLLEALRRYALALQAVDSKLVLVHAGEKARRQLDATGLTSVVGADNIYAHEERIGAAVRRAYGDSVAWVAARRDDEGHAG